MISSKVLLLFCNSLILFILKPTDTSPNYILQAFSLRIFFWQASRMACISANIGTSVRIFDSHRHSSLSRFVGIHCQCIFRNSLSVFYGGALRLNSVYHHGTRDDPLFNGYRSFSAAFSSISSDNGVAGKEKRPFPLTSTPSCLVDQKHGKGEKIQATFIDC